MLLLCQSLNWSFIWQKLSLQHDIKVHLEFRMSHLRGFHSVYSRHFHGKMHFNFDMRIFRDDNLSIFCQPCLSIIARYDDLILNIIVSLDIPYFHNSGLFCSLFHQLKLKTALIQANEWKYWMESFRPSDFEHYKLKISFHTEPRSRLWHWEPHISDKIDRKYFIRQWLLVAP